MSAERIQLILTEDARVEGGGIANAPYLAVKIAEAADERLLIAKEGLLEIARIWDGWAPANIARQTLARLEQ